MQPQIPILAQSENKSRFLERLGISDQLEEDKRLYAMMKVTVPQLNSEGTCLTERPWF